MGEGREYGLISKRSKQILGQEILPVEGSVCAAPESCGSAGSGQDKRRKQVLQAQRTHRQRTQIYIKMLEKEVLRLRQTEREALNKAQSLQRQLDALLQTPRQGGISSPTTSDGHSDYQSSYSHVTSSMEGDRGVHVNVEFSKGSSILSPTTSYRSSHGQNHSAWPDFAMPPMSHAPHRLPETVSTLGNPCALLADPRAGVKFVLGLETDCMDHLRGKHLDHMQSNFIDSERDISGHVSTACLSLWQHQTSNLSTGTTYDISSDELERLLCSSLNLGLTLPEITPVQIWNQIRWLDFSGGQYALENLITELREHVVCLGFGAVLDASIVEGILKRYFVHLPTGLTGLAD